jgi:hypothetical protein
MIWVAAEALAAPLRAAALSHYHLSTLVVHTQQQPALAALDPRDRLALRRLAAFAGETRLWWVLPAESDILESIGTLRREFGRMDTCWCVAGENRALADEPGRAYAGAYWPCRRETAWEALRSSVQPTIWSCC